MEGVPKKKKKGKNFGMLNELFFLRAIFLIHMAETFRRQKDEVPEIVDACLTWLEKNGN